MKKLLAILSILLLAGLFGIASRGLAGAGQEPAQQEPPPPKQEAPPPKQEAPPAKQQAAPPAEEAPHAGVDLKNIPADESERKNPVKPTGDSIAAGKRFFVTQCTMCHGDNGNGKGDLAVDLKWKLRDWTDADSLKEFTDGALFYILTKGSDNMPGQEDRMKDEQKWNVVNYIRSLAKKEAGNSEEKKP